MRLSRRLCPWPAAPPGRAPGRETSAEQTRPRSLGARPFPVAPSDSPCSLRCAAAFAARGILTIAGDDEDVVQVADRFPTLVASRDGAFLPAAIGENLT